MIMPLKTKVIVFLDQKTNQVYDLKQFDEDISITDQVRQFEIESGLVEKTCYGIVKEVKMKLKIYL